LLARFASPPWRTPTVPWARGTDLCIHTYEKMEVHPLPLNNQKID
jgi:hypothetical protein